MTISQKGLTACSISLEVRKEFKKASTPLRLKLSMPYNEFIKRIRSKASKDSKFLFRIMHSGSKR